jgi:1-acyl-sn-glycerol-3-phosphate acyltransferase
VQRSTAMNSNERDTHLGEEAVARMREVLQDGCSLILFPEGTRGSGTTIGQFRSGLYYLGRERPDIEIVPVHLLNLNRVLPKGQMIPLPIVTRITFGVPFRLNEGEDRHAFLERARQAVLSAGNT